MPPKDDPRSERERATTESWILCVYGEYAPAHGCACCNCEGVKELWDAAIDAAAKVAREHSIPTKLMGHRYDALCPEGCHGKIADKILALKGDRNVEQSGTE